MIYIFEERKGGNANGRRDFSGTEVPTKVRCLLNTQK